MAEEWKPPLANGVKLTAPQAQRPLDELLTSWRVACGSWLQRAQLLLGRGHAKVCILGMTVASGSCARHLSNALHVQISAAIQELTQRQPGGNLLREQPC